MDARADGVGVSSIQEINQLPREMAEGLYARLVPDDLLTRFAIDPQTLKGPEGTRLVRITAPADKPWARVEVRSSTEDRDPALLVDVEMSVPSVPSLAFVQITNPRAARYGIDRDHEGRDTLFGTVSRNVDEEIRARSDGLAPGQVRRGLTMLPKVLEAMDGFCRLMGTELYLIEPLFYHSAILYERHGCGYLLGREARQLLALPPPRRRGYRAGPELGPPRRGRAQRVGRGEDVPGGGTSRRHQHLPGWHILTR